MNELNVFVSVGGTATEQQEAFVRAVEDRLRSEGLIPHTVGRNAFSADAPLKTVTELLDRCSGTIVIALERSYFASGTEKRGGPKEIALADVKLPTPWNQVEAAMTYARGLPLMVVVEAGLKSEGLLERGYDWYVQWVKPEAAALSTNEFNGVLASWKKKMIEAPKKTSTSKMPADLTVAELVGGLKPVQLWSVLVALSAIVAGAFALGGKLFGGP
ncbi:MAG: hypothetical protein ABTS16_23270 [Candidatus Accumulibacter phosphatis]|jgi:hypothetical protein|uniref:DUF4062 domain-containing protein n=2 Tax=Candidatus Accumulibacter TaxID=327159 RepID=A0A080M0D1_9PROT|nr:hypothetical protein [Candidatus Accumulibacter contiguus]KFB70689.1 MAG: hypothetical protein AW09_004205 [Candidatus Accumulibacter phosphatis]NMQ05859.1 hypothetical protein [Candidatus Accumulibacter contiguus]HRF13926.1 hypothetical protein [Candidatus Accumulibacter phosphatis]